MLIRLRCQRGSVLPYVLAIVVAVLMSAHYVFNAYKLSNESTRMQNTSDATAYSVATVYAQNYNFVALSNRSLVANQITMAQVVTMASWARLIATFATTINDIGQYIPYVSAYTSYLEQFAEIVDEAVSAAAPIITQVVQKYIVAISELQKLAVPLSLVIAQEVMEEVIEKNDPDIDYSFSSVLIAGKSVGHIENLYGPNDCSDQADEVRENGKDAGDKETLARCRQFRNVTMASRDGFTASRTYTFKQPGQSGKTTLWGVGAIDVSGKAIKSTISIERSGSTIMGGDTPDVNDVAPFTTWSAIDAVSLHASTTYIKPFSGKKTTDYRERAKLGVGHAYVGNEDARYHHHIHEGLDHWEHNPAGSACTDPDLENGYGAGHKSKNDGAFVLLDVLTLDCDDLSDRYGESFNDDDDVGLTDFYNLDAEGYVEEKDHLMVYLKKDRGDVKTASETTGGNSSEEYKLDRYEGAQNNELHGAAGAGVYFRRGNDSWMLNSARRVDERMEFGNTYNPFWEARLAKLTTEEKVMLEVLKEQ